MKVLLVNGSPRPQGCTYTALSEMADQFSKLGIETEIFQIGAKPIRGCIGCRQCRKLGKCVFNDDIANELLAKMLEADGIVLGSPVYFAGPSGAFCAALDRVIFAATNLSDKVCAAVVSTRRGGASAAYDRLNKYFTARNCQVASSSFWNSVHGNTPEEVRQDLEGLHTLRNLAVNMAAMLENQHREGAVQPQRDKTRVHTNFIR
ncbi:MAG: flavodoxin family protein [Candidatus Bruticola sp.]